MLTGSRLLIEMAKKKWNSEGVIEEIKMLERSGVDLSATCVQKVRSDLYSAAQSRFRGWYDALKAAGISPEKYWRIRPDLERRRRALPSGSWNKERVIQKLKVLNEQSEDLSCYHCQFKYQGLYNAAARYFGNWGNAIKAAGIDYDLIRQKHKKYTQEELLNWLRDLKTQGISLNYATIRSIDMGKVSAIEKRFGSYRSAVETLGLDYRSIRKSNSSRKYWTKTKIIEELKTLKANGEDIRPTALARNHSGLMDSARDFFINSEEMYGAAEIDATQIGMLKKWTKDGVISTLKELNSKKECIRPRALCKKHAGLYKAGVSFFGNPANMYKAADIDISSIDYQPQLSHRYSKEKVIQALKNLHSEGKDISPTAIERDYPGLNQARKRFFTGFSEMYSASGFDPTQYVKHKHGYWSKEKVIELIRELDAAGEELPYRSVRLHHGDLTTASYRFFPSWNEACKSAGIKEDKYFLQASPNYYDKERIIQEIRKLHDLGADLNHLAVKKRNPLLLSRAVHRFRSWYDAVEDAGISSDQYRKFAKEGFWTKARILEHLKTLAVTGEDLSHNHMQRTHGKLLSAAVAKFGTWRAAISEAGLEYARIRRIHARFTNDELLAYLRDLHSQGVSLDSTTMKTINQSMLNIIWHRFGSYRKAIEAIGLNYDSILKSQAKEIFMGRLFEKYLKEALDILEWNVKYQKQFRRLHENGDQSFQT